MSVFRSASWSWRKVKGSRSCFSSNPTAPVRAPHTERVWNRALPQTWTPLSSACPQPQLSMVSPQSFLSMAPAHPALTGLTPRGSLFLATCPSRQTMKLYLPPLMPGRGSKVPAMLFLITHASPLPRLPCGGILTRTPLPLLT